jgi:hypothetical protein
MGAGQTDHKPYVFNTPHFSRSAPLEKEPANILGMHSFCNEYAASWASCVHLETEVTRGQQEGEEKQGSIPSVLLINRDIYSNIYSDQHNLLSCFPVLASQPKYYLTDNQYSSTQQDPMTV